MSEGGRIITSVWVVLPFRLNEAVIPVVDVPVCDDPP
jgi:hypothetical protein